MQFGWLKSEKHLLSWIVNKVLRSGWAKHPVKMQLTERATHKAPIGMNGRMINAIQCNMCKQCYRPKELQVNHKKKCVENGISWEELPNIIRRMFLVQLNDLEHLCKECHDLVTFTERYGGTIKEAKLEKKVIKFGKLPAKSQISKLVKAGLVPAKNVVDRKEQVRQYLKARQ